MTEIFQREWVALQNKYEQYEFLALFNKLAALGVLLALNPGRLVLVLLALLWLQEAIFKTYQARLGERLLKVEQGLREGALPSQGMQLHSEWQARRPGVAGLLAQYLSQALRPSLACSYVILLAVTLYRFMAW